MALEMTPGTYTWIYLLSAHGRNGVRVHQREVAGPRRRLVEGEIQVLRDEASRISNAIIRDVVFDGLIRNDRARRFIASWEMGYRDPSEQAHILDLRRLLIEGGCLNMPPDVLLKYQYPPLKGFDVPTLSLGLPTGLPAGKALVEAANHERVGNCDYFIVKGISSHASEPNHEMRIDYSLLEGNPLATITIQVYSPIDAQESDALFFSLRSLKTFLEIPEDLSQAGGKVCLLPTQRRRITKDDVDTFLNRARIALQQENRDHVIDAEVALLAICHYAEDPKVGLYAVAACKELFQLQQRDAAFERSVAGSMDWDLLVERLMRALELTDDEEVTLVIELFMLRAAESDIENGRRTINFLTQHPNSKVQLAFLKFSNQEGLDVVSLWKSGIRNRYFEYADSEDAERRTDSVFILVEAAIGGVVEAEKLLKPWLHNPPMPRVAMEECLARLANEKKGRGNKKD